MLTSLLTTELSRLGSLEVASSQKLYDTAKQLGRAEGDRSVATEVARRAGVSVPQGRSALRRLQRARGVFLPHALKLVYLVRSENLAGTVIRVLEVLAALGALGGVLLELGRERHGLNEFLECGDAIRSAQEIGEGLVNSLDGAQWSSALRPHDSHLLH